jgi:hypothetical protein
MRATLGVTLGDRWFELDGMCREEMLFEDMVASRGLQGVVGRLYVEPPVECHWSRMSRSASEGVNDRCFAAPVRRGIAESQS